MNARVLFAGALTDANLSVVLGREGIFFSVSENIFPAFHHFLAFQCLTKNSLSYSVSTVSCKKKKEFALHTL